MREFELPPPPIPILPMFSLYCVRMGERYVEGRRREGRGGDLISEAMSTTHDMCLHDVCRTSRAGWAGCNTY